MPKAKKAAANNDELIAMFLEMSQLESVAGGKGKWAANAYKKVAKSLGEVKGKVKSGKEASKLPGVGKASSDKIQEYLDTGSISKLEELRDEYGDLGGMKMTAKDVKGKPLKAAVKNKMKKVAAELMSLSAAAMKMELKLNDQKVTGTKSELSDRIAEGRVLGACPRCPSCHLGRLRFDPKTGLHSCPGGYDDTDYVACSYVSGDLKRGEWQTPDEEDSSSSSDTESSATESE